MAQLEDDNQSIFNIDTNNQETKTETETEEDDDDELIYFEIDAINIALSIGAAALLSQVLGSDSDGGDDTSFPVITINGDNPATVELGNVYNDAGASAVDSDGNSLNVSSTGNVNTTLLGHTPLLIQPQIQRVEFQLQLEQLLLLIQLLQ